MEAPRDAPGLRAMARSLHVSADRNVIDDPAPMGLELGGGQPDALRNRLVKQLGTASSSTTGSPLDDSLVEIPHHHEPLRGCAQENPFEMFQIIFVVVPFSAYAAVLRGPRPLPRDAHPPCLASSGSRTRQGPLPVPHDTSRHELVPATPSLARQARPLRASAPPLAVGGTLPARALPRIWRTVPLRCADRLCCCFAARHWCSSRCCHHTPGSSSRQRRGDHSLGWDPQTQRLHALRGKIPEHDKENRSVRAAVFLASLALPMFPCFAVAGGLQTTGFHREDNDDWFSWPIWREPISLATLRSLLSHPFNGDLEQRGVDVVCRCRVAHTGGSQGNYQVFGHPEERHWPRSVGGQA